MKGNSQVGEVDPLWGGNRLSASRRGRDHWKMRDTDSGATSLIKEG
jgi:hypothetical protein